MAAFDTPEPITARIEVNTGTIQLRASDRRDTVVEVNPSDPSDPLDARAAEQARVEYSQGKLLIKVPPQLRGRPGAPRQGGSVDVTVGLPEGSHVRAGSAWASLDSEGRLGECRFDTVHSDVRLDQTGPLRLTVSQGDITVGKAVGDVKIAQGSGAVRIEEIDGDAVIGNDNGDIRIGDVTGKLKMTGMNGDFVVRRAHANVETKTVHGTVRIGEVARGSVVVTASSAEVEIGIRAGTAAKLDISTVSGSVHNGLADVEGPAQSDEVVGVRARTFSGNVIIRRAW